MEVYRLSEVLPVSITMMMEAAGIAEAPVNLYHTTRRTNAEDGCCLQPHNLLLQDSFQLHIRNITNLKIKCDTYIFTLFKQNAINNLPQ
jgi:hypothetical protein